MLALTKDTILSLTFWLSLLLIVRFFLPLLYISYGSLRDLSSSICFLSLLSFYIFSHFSLRYYSVADVVFSSTMKKSLLSFSIIWLLNSLPPIKIKINIRKVNPIYLCIISVALLSFDSRSRRMYNNMIIINRYPHSW